MTTVIHDLKVLPPFFEPLSTGLKTFEVRRNDRGFNIGDYLLLREWDILQGYSGKSVYVRVLYILDWWPEAIKDGFVVMSIARVGWITIPLLMLTFASSAKDISREASPTTSTLSSNAPGKKSRLLGTSVSARLILNTRSAWNWVKVWLKRSREEH